MTVQFGRKSSLLVSDGTDIIDLSQLHFTFKVEAADIDSPNNCVTRVFNISKQTQAKILVGNFARVIINAGYEGAFGAVFDGTIKQFRTGRLSNVDSYLDILAADGDLAYNYSTIKEPAAAGTTKAQIAQKLAKSLEAQGVTADPTLFESLNAFGGTIPAVRGKVLWGSSRIHLNNLVESMGASWSIQNGKLQILPLAGYADGEAVKLTSATGLIGVPQQTADGIVVRALLNPKIKLGGRIQLENAIINQELQRNPISQTYNFGVPFNQRVGLSQPLATIATDGFYRVFVAEHTGDTRGQDWYTDIVALAVDSTSGKVQPYGRPP